ncbi:TadE/TadG family type IV pilus assembly protein [Aureimonas ureilytica]|uniref:TadE/TadG family type IV pilus assembly protein n=1 Tax=Aureimonas ureilytica TaxID=401562 RepID=UPI00036B1B4C|nr:TadE/TadG family type IV pilus assembly protein [Aureimonas ureilytica]
MTRVSRHGSWRALARRLASFARCRSGSNAVEFAILAPLLCLILLGTLYIGLYLGVAHSLAQIAADVSRYAMVGDSTDTRRELAQSWLRTTGRDYPLIDPERLTIVVDEKADLLRVSVRYDMSYLPMPDLLRHSAQVPTSLVRTAAVLIP